MFTFHFTNPLDMRMWKVMYENAMTSRQKFVQMIVIFDCKYLRFLHVHDYSVKTFANIPLNLI